MISFFKSKISLIVSLLQNTSRNGLYVLYDFVKCRKQEGVSHQEYINFRLDRCDKGFKNSFLPYAQAKKYWQILNPERYDCLARNKYLSHMLLENAGIPTPKLIAYYDTEIAVEQENAVYDYETLAALLKRKNIKSFVLKPAVDGAHGSGVVICRELIEAEGVLYIQTYDGSQTPLANYLRKEPLLFEEVVTQTSQMASFNPSSVNTLRFVTALYPNRDVKIIGVFLKIGRDGSDIDNAGNGGNVDAGCHVENGELYNVMQFNSWEDHQQIDRHPDTGVLLRGVKIEKWESLVAQIKNFQGRIPTLKTIGWDIALTENGPLVIEINNHWDTTGQLFIGHGWKKEVIECYNAWQNYYEKNRHEAH